MKLSHILNPWRRIKKLEALFQRVLDRSSVIMGKVDELGRMVESLLDDRDRQRAIAANLRDECLRLHDEIDHYKFSGDALRLMSHCDKLGLSVYADTIQNCLKRHEAR